MLTAVNDAYGGWKQELPQYRVADAPSCAIFRNWKPYWVKLRDDRLTIGCVCVHHARHALLESALTQLRSKVHRSKGKVSSEDGTCRFGERCDCECKVCTGSKPLLRAAVCPVQDGNLPRLRCVLQECEDCGLERVLVCSKKEQGAAHLKGKVRLMRNITRSIPGYDDEMKTEPISVECTLEQVFHEVRHGTGKNPKDFR